MTSETIQTLEQHKDCPSYQKKHSPVYEVFSLREGIRISQYLKTSALVFVIEGSVEYTFSGNQSVAAKSEDFFILPPHTNFTMKFLEPATLLFLYIAAESEFCWRIKKLVISNKKAKDENLQGSLLRMNEFIRLAIKQFLAVTDKGLLCTTYLNSQIQSMLTCICCFYPDEMLAEFFAPLRLNTFVPVKGADFKEIILQNKYRFFRVSDIVAATNLSRTTVRRYFERCFNVTPQDWIDEKRRELIEHELKYDLKPLKKIAEMTGFKSVREFYGYCQKRFGKTATEIRKGI